jgi:hypothetical protein
MSLAENGQTYGTYKSSIDNLFMTKTPVHHPGYYHAMCVQPYMKILLER